MYDRATLMMEHSARNGVDVSAYWLGYTRNILLETDLVADDPLSENLFFAQTFSGGSVGFGKPAAPANLFNRLLSLIVSRPFSERIAWGIRNAPLYKTVFGPFFRLTQTLRNANKVRDAAAEIYVISVQHLFSLLKDDIKKFALSPRKRPSADDVDVVRHDPSAGQYSRESLYRFAIFLHFNELVQFKDKTILEIGTGTGEFARVALSVGQLKRYILVDIAPTLAFAERVLEDEFGAEKIDRFDPNRTSIDYDDGKIATVLTPDQLPLVKDIDIGINQASFGEMSQEIVETYVSHVVATTVTDFISINHRGGKPNNKDTMGMTEYTKFFWPSFEIARKESFEYVTLMPEFFEDQPDIEDYQLLHFKRK
ncbi:putative sugar O-methyltransferase [Rhodospirillales bacterium]|nr:putative sugar O-methyltransferase [Rhodospirillales bacterium]